MSFVFSMTPPTPKEKKVKEITEKKILDNLGNARNVMDSPAHSWTRPALDKWYGYAAKAIEKRPEFAEDLEAAGIKVTVEVIEEATQEA